MEREFENPVSRAITEYIADTSILQFDSPVPDDVKPYLSEEEQEGSMLHMDVLLYNHREPLVEQGYAFDGFGVQPRIGKADDGVPVTFYAESREVARSVINAVVQEYADLAEQMQDDFQRSQKEFQEFDEHLTAIGAPTDGSDTDAFRDYVDRYGEAMSESVSKVIDVPVNYDPSRIELDYTDRRYGGSARPPALDADGNKIDDIYQIVINSQGDPTCYDHPEDAVTKGMPEANSSMVTALHETAHIVDSLIQKQPEVKGVREENSEARANEIAVYTMNTSSDMFQDISRDRFKSAYDTYLELTEYIGGQKVAQHPICGTEERILELYELQNGQM